MDYAGPLWIGRLFDEKLVSDFEIIQIIKEEARINTIGYYETHYLAKKFSLPKTIKIEIARSNLVKAGFKASKTHFSPNGIKTDAGMNDVLKAIS